MDGSTPRPPVRRWSVARAIVALSAILSAASPARTARADAETFQLADEATILADAPAALTLFRFAPNPAVLVLDFASLASQGSMLNRLAALTEKRGLPHDRLLDDTALDAAIRATGDTAATWYYGHDYPARDVLRFFALADRDGIALNPDEQHLRRLVVEAQLQTGGFGALISLAAPSPTYGLDASARAAILHTGIAHGDYFTQDAYTSYVTHFWQTVLTGAERTAIRGYLGSQGYDTALEDLMIDEMQAALIFTPDPRYFDPAKVDIPPARLAAIRRRFVTGLLLPGQADAQPLGLTADLARLAAAP